MYFEPTTTPSWTVSACLWSHPLDFLQVTLFPWVLNLTRLLKRKLASGKISNDSVQLKFEIFLRWLLWFLWLNPSLWTLVYRTFAISSSSTLFNCETFEQNHPATAICTFGPQFQYLTAASCAFTMTESFRSLSASI